jgi:hypothetical protein
MFRITISLCLLLTSIGALAQSVTYPSLGKGIKIIAEDSTLSMKINVRMQNLLEVDYNKVSNETDTRLLVRRWRLKFGGYAVSPDLRYKLELGFSNRDQGNSATGAFGNSGSNIILDAVVKYFLFEDFDIWFGQTKLPGNRERVISSADLQFVDRSVLNSKLNIDRDAGIQIRYKFGNDFVVKPIFSLSLGEGRNITVDNAGGFAYTFRTEFLPFGDFDDYVSSAHKFYDEHKLAIGGTFSFNDGTNRQGGQIGSFVYDTSGTLVHNDMYSYFVDLHYKYKGISVMTEVAKKEVDLLIPDLVKNFRTGESVNFQVGYLFDNYWELAGRYSYIRPDNSSSDINELTEYTFGISKYLAKHKLKLQTDFSYFDNFDLDDKTTFRYRFQVELQL